MHLLSTCIIFWPDTDKDLCKKWSLNLADVNENEIAEQCFRKILQYQIEWNSVLRFSSCVFIRMGGREIGLS
jgi:hypothetical protein